MYRLRTPSVVVTKTTVDNSRRTCAIIHATRRFTTATATSASDEQQDLLLQEASALTRSFYRLCFRSIRHIRYGNQHDEQDFQRRETERLQQFDQPLLDSRLSMLSMLPPVNREDELRSRADYYKQYTRENIVQESDCLSYKVWEERHVERYVHLLRNGNNHRRWLLTDMKFADPYEDFAVLGAKQLEEFEEKARAMVRKTKGQGGQDQQIQQEQHKDDDDDDDDGFWDEDDEEEPQGLPEWYKNHRR